MVAAFSNGGWTRHSQFIQICGDIPEEVCPWDVDSQLLAPRSTSKINTRSSTEAKIVGVDDFMPAVCWTRYFMEAQGYPISDNVVFQDNKSAILLEKNGKASSSKRTKHIHIRYFFITNRVSKGEVSLVWCPTGDMTGDYMTKPVQGAPFRKFRDQIMGVVPAQDPGIGKLKSKQVKPRKGKTNGLGQPGTTTSGRTHRSVLKVDGRLKDAGLDSMDSIPPLG